MTEELNLKVSIDSTQFRKDVEVIKNEFVNAALEIKKTVSEKSVLSQVQIGDDKSQVINTPVAKTDEKVELENLLTQYQDYVDKRLAIENKYNKDLSFLREQRELAEKNGDVAEEKRLTRAIAQAEVKRGKELITKDLEMLKQSPALQSQPNRSFSSKN